MIALKKGVKLRLLSPQMVVALMIVHAVYARNNAICTVTSANDSTHSLNSLHYGGNALDFRTKNYASNKSMLLEEVKQSLGDEYDVVLEGLDTDNEHMHVEYDPK
jgi:hypothetical protein